MENTSTVIAQSEPVSIEKIMETNREAQKGREAKEADPFLEK